MKARIAITSYLFLLFICSYGQTNVPGGDVYGTWQASGSPYLVEGDILVPAGESLIIEPGVEVRFQGYYKFEVYGIIQAIGTESDSIIFRAQNPFMGYHGIKIWRDTTLTGWIDFAYCRFQNGNPMGTWPDNCGGGIGIWYYDDIRIQHCIFKDNKAVQGSYPSGGGICVAGFDGLISNCVFIRNEAKEGGAIMFWDGSDGIIEDCYFERNYAGNDGGAIQIWDDCDPFVSNNEIIRNYAINYGGGIAVWDSSAPVLEYNLIDDNTAGNLGGGVFLYSYCNAVIRWNEFSRDSSFAHGGGLCIGLDSDPLVEHNLFYKNYSVWDGGAIEMMYSCDPMVINNTVHNNTAGWHGGGVDIYDMSDPLLINNIIWGNTGQWSAQVNVYDTTCEPQFYNNDIQYGKDSLGNFIAQGIYEDNIDTIPDFVGGLPFNYQLNATSACIDAGHDTIIDPDLTRSDIGAYYFDQTGIGTGDFIAEESRLHLDNYPNPFTDNTVIRFSLPELSVTTCRLSIFDIRGTEIDVITNERLSGGKYQSEYDASDLPNGIYIMRLQVGEKMVSSKMVKM